MNHLEFGWLSQGHRNVPTLKRTFNWKELINCLEWKKNTIDSICLRAQYFLGHLAQ